MAPILVKSSMFLQRKFEFVVLNIMNACDKTS